MLGVGAALDVNAVAFAEGAEVAIWARLLGATLARCGEDGAELQLWFLGTICGRGRNKRVIDRVNFGSAACCCVVAHEEASAADFAFFGVLCNEERELGEGRDRRWEGVGALEAGLRSEQDVNGVDSDQGAVRPHEISEVGVIESSMRSIGDVPFTVDLVQCCEATNLISLISNLLRNTSARDFDGASAVQGDGLSLEEGS